MQQAMIRQGSNTIIKLFVVLHQGVPQRLSLVCQGQVIHKIATKLADKHRTLSPRVQEHVLVAGLWCFILKLSQTKDSISFQVKVGQKKQMMVMLWLLLPNNGAKIMTQKSARHKHRRSKALC